jgi:hypothetical protein
MQAAAAATAPTKTDQPAPHADLFTFSQWKMVRLAAAALVLLD